MNTKIPRALAVAALALPPPLLAQIETAPASDNAPATETTPPTGPDEAAVTFEVGAGLEYDSNVALLEVDTSTNAGDTVGSFKFGLGYDLPNDGRFDWKAGYNFSQTMHQDFDAFDIRLHRGSSTLSWDFGRVDFGTMIQHADADLDGHAFMTLTQVSPYVTKLAGNKLFMRFAYIDTDKDYAGNPLRAAAAASWSSDIYVFLNGLTTYLLLGARIDDEDAIDPQFDYRADKLRIQLSHRFAMRSRELTLKLGLSSEARDYSSETPSIGAVRNDDRLQLEATGELPVGEHMTMDFGYKRSNNDSNLPAVNFDEDVFSFTLTGAF